MSNKQWLEGATYQFKPDMIEKFKVNSSCNKRIAVLLRYDKFTVKRVGAGNVQELVEFRKDDIDIQYWFEENEIRYFDLVEDTTEELPMNNTNNIRPVADIVVEWLDKLVYVSANDYTVTDMLYLNKDGAVLTTDFSDICGSNNIYTFITNRYELLQQEAKHKKNNELMERKAKLEAELAEVNKELGNV